MSDTPPPVNVTDLKLSGRANNPLAKAGIVTIDQLCARTARDLSNLPGFGGKTLAEVELALKGLGRALAGKLPLAGDVPASAPALGARPPSAAPPPSVAARGPRVGDFVLRGEEFGYVRLAGDAAEAPQMELLYDIDRAHRTPLVKTVDREGWIVVPAAAAREVFGATQTAMPCWCAIAGVARCPRGYVYGTHEAEELPAATVRGASLKPSGLPPLNLKPSAAPLAMSPARDDMQYGGGDCCEHIDPDNANGAGDRLVFAVPDDNSFGDCQSPSVATLRDMTGVEAVSPSAPSLVGFGPNGARREINDTSAPASSTTTVVTIDPLTPMLDAAGNPILADDDTIYMTARDPAQAPTADEIRRYLRNSVDGAMRAVAVEKYAARVRLPVASAERALGDAAALNDELEDRARAAQVRILFEACDNITAWLAALAETYKMSGDAASADEAVAVQKAAAVVREGASGIFNGFVRLKLRLAAAEG